MFSAQQIKRISSLYIGKNCLSVRLTYNIVCCCNKQQQVSYSVSSFLRKNMDPTVPITDYTRFMNQAALLRKPSPIRETAKFLVAGSPNLVFLASGVPNPQLFPFQEVNISLTDGSVIKMSGKTMTSALQYLPTPGLQKLLDQLRSFQKTLHNPPLESMDILVTSGSQDGLCKAFEMLLEPEDYVILQEPTYPGVLSMLHPFRPKYLVVDGDEHGMKPESLANVLSAQWTPEAVRSAKTGVPKVLYVNPNGANPSGTCIPEDRKRAIYEIARQYNLVILEDDPYYFLQFENMRSPSFLSMDVEGRVIRFDSFSKVLSSGVRIGYVTGPKGLLNPMMLHMQVSVLHASSLSQVLICELLESWGLDGFLKHVQKIQEFYINQRDVMVAAAEKYLNGLAEWNVPQAGMFLWMNVKGVDTYPMIMERALAKDVILVPGNAFMTESGKPCSYLRAAFSVATPDQIDRGMKSLAELIKEELALQKKIKS